jgi:hypothetical protein
MSQEDLLDEYPPGYDPDEITAEEFYACPVGVTLREQYRAEHHDAPAEPPPSEEEVPLATAYWDHIAGCGNCNED